MVNEKIKVNGMNCGSCKLAVENSIQELDGVSKAEADLESGLVDLEFDSDKVSIDEIDEAVEEAGFSVEK